MFELIWEHVWGDVKALWMRKRLEKCYIDAAYLPFHFTNDKVLESGTEGVRTTGTKAKKKVTLDKITRENIFLANLSASLATSTVQSKGISMP